MIWICVEYLEGANILNRKVSYYSTEELYTLPYFQVLLGKRCDEVLCKKSLSKPEYLSLQS